MIAYSLVLLLSLAAEGPVAAPGPATEISPSEIEAAIKQLAAEDFQERERATEILMHAGEAARAAAEAAAKSTDPEVALRARIVLKRLDSGIRPGTPAPIVALIEEFKNVDQSRKSSIILRLASPAEFQAIGEQIAKVKNVEHSSLESMFHGRLTSIVSQNYREQKLDEAEQILAALPSSPRTDATLATFLHLSGRLPKRIDELTKQVAARPSPASYKQLALFDRAAGKLPEARASAQNLTVAENDLPLWLACEAADWPAALRLNRARYEGQEPTAPQLAFTLLLSYYAKDDESFAAAKEEFAKRAETKPEELWDAAEALLAAEQLDDAIKLLEKGVPAAAFYLHWYRTHFNKALALANAAEGTKFDAAWYQALPDGNTVKTGLSVARYYYARDIASCLHNLGRREDARQVRDLLADAVRGQPPASSAWTALVSTDLRLGLRDLALADAAKALEPPAPRRSASTASMNYSVTTLLYDQSVIGSMYSVWPHVLTAAGDDPLAALQLLDPLLHPPAAARLSQEERRQRLYELIGLQGTPERYRQRDYLRTVGGLAARLGEEDMAYRCRRQSISLTSSSDDEKRLLMGSEAFSDKDWHRTAQLLMPVDPSLPNYIGYLDQLAIALEMLGDKERAAKVRDQAVALRLEPGTIASQAVGLLALGQKGTAAERFRTVARLLPPGDGTTINALNSLGNSVYEAKPGEAIGLWQLNMLGPLRGTNNMPLDTHIKNLCVIRRVQARDLIAQGKYAEALVHCHAEMDIMPGNVAVIDQVAPLFAEQGQQQMTDELFERSFKTYSEFCAKYPQSTAQRNILARTCARAKRRLEEAQKALDEAFATEPERPELYATQAELHLARGDNPAAIAVAERGLQVQPKHPGCEAMLAKAKGDAAVAVPESE